MDSVTLVNFPNRGHTKAFTDQLSSEERFAVSVGRVLVDIPKRGPLSRVLFVGY